MDVDRRIRPVEFAGGRLHDERLHETALADARLMEFRRQARRGRPVMRLIQLDADEAPAHVPSRYQRAAGARERIEHHVARLGESFEQRRENSDRLLCRMQAVSRIGPGDHVGRRIRRRLRIALHQQIGLLTPCGCTPGGLRRYSEEDLARVARIRQLQELLGLNLDEISLVLRGEDRLAEIRLAYHDEDTSRAERRALVRESLELQQGLRAAVEAKRQGIESFLTDLDSRIAKMRALLDDMAASEAQSSARSRERDPRQKSR